MPQETYCAEILVKGHVHGVGFRYFVRRYAAILGIKGYVKNVVDANNQFAFDLYNKYKS